MIKLKILLSLFFVLSFIPMTLFGQYTCTIEINGLKNNNGQVLLELSNEKGENIMGISQDIANNKCIIVIKNLKPGKFAFKYFHDLNKNKKLDTNWIGLPKEGYGFSNNAKGKFGPPSFEETIFVIKKNTTIMCIPKYIKF